MHLSPDDIIFWQHGFLKLNATVAFTWGLMFVLAVGSKLVTRKLSKGLQRSRWQNLLECARSFGAVSAAVVCARLGDHQLWAEVLQNGAYDLIIEPYDEKEIARIVEGALDSAILRREWRAPSPTRTNV